MITNSGKYKHTHPLFRNLQILQLKQIHTYKIALTMFKVQSYKTPAVLPSLFKINEIVHSYHTRQSKKFHVPAARTNYMQRAISVKGVRIWNQLSDLLSFDCSLLTFKHNLKKYLIESNMSYDF